MEYGDVGDSLAIMESELGRAAPSAAPEGFNETLYIKAFADVADAIAGGQFLSGLEHFKEYGEREYRLVDDRYLRLVQALDAADFPECAIDAVFETRAGYVMVIGWINDDAPGDVGISLMHDRNLLATSGRLARCRRDDAQTLLGGEPGRLLGFWSIIKTGPAWETGRVTGVAISHRQDKRRFPVAAQKVSQERMRALTLEYLSSARHFSNSVIESCAQLDNGIGQAIIDLNVKISAGLIKGADIERFGAPHKTFTASIIVCLYGKVEFLFLQAAAFATAPGSDGYEFIYVCNSPELSESLAKEAALAHKIYGLSITLVILAGNAGFGAANNIAVQAARTNRVYMINPDVFPRAPNWARRLAGIVEAKPKHQTDMFGVPLFYDDGSLMHGGMFIDMDRARSIHPTGMERRDMLRVEHYGKGAPAGATHHSVARAVPAVTGAFISADRGWFEFLGGFSPEYVFGHYEDADLCLKSLAAGRPVWLQNIPFWHLEGKGSLRQPIHEAGSIVNRWHFTRMWSGFVADGLLGAAPERFATPHE